MAAGIEFGQELIFACLEEDNPRSVVPLLNQLFDVDPYLKPFRRAIEQRFDTFNTVEAFPNFKCKPIGPARPGPVNSSRVPTHSYAMPLLYAHN